MKRIIRLTESDLARIVKRVMNEQSLKKALDAGFHDTTKIVSYVLKQPTIGKMVGGKQGGDISVWEVNFPSVMRWNGENFESLKTDTAYLICGESKNSTFTTNVLHDSPSGDGPKTVFEPNGPVGQQFRAWCDKNASAKSMANVKKFAPGNPGQLKAYLGIYGKNSGYTI